MITAFVAVTSAVNPQHNRRCYMSGMHSVGLKCLLSEVTVPQQPPPSLHSGASFIPTCFSSLVDASFRSDSNVRCQSEPDRHRHVHATAMTKRSRDLGHGVSALCQVSSELLLTEHIQTCPDLYIMRYVLRSDAHAQRSGTADASQTGLWVHACCRVWWTLSSRCQRCQQHYETSCLCCPVHARGYSNISRQMQNMTATLRVVSLVSVSSSGISGSPSAMMVLLQQCLGTMNR